MITPVHAAVPRTTRRITSTSTSAFWVRSARIVLLMLVDMGVVAAVSLAAIFFWAINVRHQQLGTYLELAPLLVLFPLGFAKAGLYPGFGLGAIETVRRLVLRTSFIFLILAAGSFVMKTPAVYSRMTFFLAWAGSLVLLPIGRLTFLSLVHGLSWWGEAVAVVGMGATSKRLIHSLERALSLGYRPRWVLTDGVLQDDFEGLPALGLEGAEELARQGVNRALVVADDVDQAESVLVELQRFFRHVILISTDPSVPIEGVLVRNLGGMLGVEFQNRLLQRRHQIVKRLMDVGLGLAALVLAVPIVLIAALLVKLVDRGPAFFCQWRRGFADSHIKVWKLRTMYTDADQRLEKYLESHPRARQEWERRFKLEDDPRILPVLGTFLRRFSLDELPQLLSVVRGEMSLVGPRPFPDYHLSKFSSDFRHLRCRVRPGLTGLWQVMIRSDGSVYEQELFDTHYIRNWSVWMDLYVLGRTAWAVVFGKGAF